MATNANDLAQRLRDGVVPDGTDLTGANLSGETFQNTRFDDLILVNANLTNMTARDCNYQGVNLEGADFSGSDLEGSRFGASGHGQTQRFPIFRNTKFNNVNFKSCYLLTVPTLTNTSFDDSDLSSSVFGERTVFEGCSFKGAVLTRTRLDNVNLTGADFTSADLRGTSFRNSNLTGINISYAFLGNTPEFRNMPQNVIGGDLAFRDESAYIRHIRETRPNNRFVQELPPPPPRRGRQQPEQQQRNTRRRVTTDEQRQRRREGVMERHARLMEERARQDAEFHRLAEQFLNGHHFNQERQVQEGLAFEVHNKGNKFSKQTLIDFYEKIAGTSPSNCDSTSYKQFFKDNMSNLIRENSRFTREEKATHLKDLNNKVLSCFSGYLPKPEEIKLVCCSVDYVSKQDEIFIQLYIDAYMLDTVKAYTGQQTMSCPKGSIERVYLYVAKACEMRVAELDMFPLSEDKINEYKEIIKIIDNPIKDLLGGFANEWIENIKDMPNTLEGRKESLIKFIKDKLKNEHKIEVLKGDENYIVIKEFVDSDYISTPLSDLSKVPEYFGGRKRKTRRANKKSKRSKTKKRSKTRKIRRTKKSKIK